MSKLYMLRDHWYTANALRCVPVYSPVVVGRPIHCAYTLRDGQAELARGSQATHEDVLTSRRRSPIQLLTGSNVEQRTLIATDMLVVTIKLKRRRKRDFISNAYRREQFKSDLPDDVNRVQFV